jgi:hypothetical protein
MVGVDVRNSWVMGEFQRVLEGKSITPGRGSGQAPIIEMAAKSAVRAVGYAIGRDDAEQAMLHTMPERMLLARRNSKPDLIQARS